jgi:hypothetical protein
VADTFDHVNVGVAGSTVSSAVVVALLKFAVSVGANVAVIVDVPAPAMVMAVPDAVAVPAVPDAYVHAPATSAPLSCAVGFVGESGASPNVLLIADKVPSDGVAFATVTVNVTVPPET